MEKQFKHIEGTGKPLKFVSPVNSIDITKGTEYTVESQDEKQSENKGYGFLFFDDSGFRRFSMEKESLAINWHNWIVTERSPE